MIPHKCPVCDGSGLVSRPPWIAGDQPYFATSSVGPWPCKVCQGAGILWESAVVAATGEPTQNTGHYPPIQAAKAEKDGVAATAPAPGLPHEWSVMGRCVWCGTARTGRNGGDPCPERKAGEG